LAISCAISARFARRRPPPHMCRYRAEDTLRCATFRDISVDVLFFAVPTDRPTRRPAFSAAARWHFQSPARAPRGATRRSLRQVSKTSSAITDTNCHGDVEPVYGEARDNDRRQVRARWRFHARVGRGGGDRPRRAQAPPNRG